MNLHKQLATPPVEEKKSAGREAGESAPRSVSAAERKMLLQLDSVPAGYLSPPISPHMVPKSPHENGINGKARDVLRYLLMFSAGDNMKSGSLQEPVPLPDDAAALSPTGSQRKTIVSPVAQPVAPAVIPLSAAKKAMTTSLAPTGPTEWQQAEAAAAQYEQLVSQANSNANRLPEPLSKRTTTAPIGSLDEQVRSCCPVAFFHIVESIFSCSDGCVQVRALQEQLNRVQQEKERVETEKKQLVGDSSALERELESLRKERQEYVVFQMSVAVFVHEHVALRNDWSRWRKSSWLL